MNPTRNQPRLVRLEKECTASAAQAVLLAAALSVLATLFALGAMWS